MTTTTSDMAPAEFLEQLLLARQHVDLQIGQLLALCDTQPWERIGPLIKQCRKNAADLDAFILEAAGPAYTDLASRLNRQPGRWA